MGAGVPQVIGNDLGRGWGQREEGDREVPTSVLGKHGGRPRGLQRQKCRVPKTDETGAGNVRGRRGFHTSEEQRAVTGAGHARRGLAFLAPLSEFVLGRGVGWF